MTRLAVSFSVLPVERCATVVCTKPLLIKTTRGLVSSHAPFWWDVHCSSTSHLQHYLLLQADFPRRLSRQSRSWSETLSMSILNRTWSCQCQCCGTPYLFPVNNSRSCVDRRYRSRCLLTGICSHCGRNEVKKFDTLIGYLPFARDRVRWLRQQSNNKWSHLLP